MGVPPGLPVHILDGHSHHLDFPNAFSIFFTNQDSGKIGIMRASQNENDHPIWIQHENDKSKKASTHTYKKNNKIILLEGQEICNYCVYPN